MRASKRRPDRGQVVPLVAVIILLAGAAAIVVADLGGRATARARARTAADGAALAGAAEGRDAAAAVARANGARLDRYEDAGADTEVKVRIGDMTATARARRDGDGSAPGTGAAAGRSRTGLDPVMVSALHRADLLLGRPVPVVSGYRSASAQTALWLRRALNPYPVAAPGTSMHERGLAIDVPRRFVSTLLSVAVQADLCQPLPMTDPVHFEPCQPTSPR